MRALQLLDNRVLAVVDLPDPSPPGAGEVQVWVRSTAPNVDLQATISEVRGDGAETFVQGGWLRTGAGDGR